MNDLVVLVPDKNMEQTVEGLLGRPKSLGIRSLTHEILVHVGRDPGCVKTPDHILRSRLKECQYALVMLDHEGSGCEHQKPDQLAAQIRECLWSNGWHDRAEVIVLVPELEVWVWSSSPHVDTCLGWANREPPLRRWLQDSHHWPEDTPKPPRPKEALEAALYQVRKARSSAIYAQLARQVTLQGHSEPAFARFVSTLQGWFAP